MKKEPIISFQGKNANIELFEKHVNVGDRRIALKNILSVKTKTPKTSCGFLHFSVAGDLASQRWTIGDEPDENTVCFEKEEDYEKAREIARFAENGKE